MVLGHTEDNSNGSQHPQNIVLLVLNNITRVIAAMCNIYSVQVPNVVQYYSMENDTYLGFFYSTKKQL